MRGGIIRDKPTPITDFVIEGLRHVIGYGHKQECFTCVHLHRCEPLALQIERFATLHPDAELLEGMEKLKPGYNEGYLMDVCQYLHKHTYFNRFHGQRGVMDLLQLGVHYGDEEVCPSS